MTQLDQPGHSTKSNSAIFLDTSLPNLARIFDYLVGGTTHFEADRQAAAEMLKILPSLRKWVRLRRAFIQEAAQILYNEGFTQFLDLASGMPSDDHLHAFAPGSRIVYSDINPVAVSYGRSLLETRENLAYIRGNAKEISEILQAPEVLKLIRLDEPVAIGINALQLFLSEPEVQTLAEALFEWAPVGSKLFLVFQTHANLEMPENYYKFLALCRQAQLPIELHTLADAVEMWQPWHTSLVEPITQFLGLPEDFITKADREGINMAFYAAFLLKK
ncbi:MAG: SAM-dependent methyltransferase [Ardenticatenaceae bacterium]|nr:SAM-dependent methyltransferase [Anaerolineales bacterium]MCB8940589.1 SAM-dependent methyltransferase [Ardenticatenaceae bacterium]MCB8971919.1 SAM-dependent methyltransferase [Ardenticatenaceae bacterium]